MQLVFLHSLFCLAGHRRFSPSLVFLADGRRQMHVEGLGGAAMWLYCGFEHMHCPCQFKWFIVHSVLYAIPVGALQSLDCTVSSRSTACHTPRRYSASSTSGGPEAILRSGKGGTRQLVRVLL